MDNLYSATVKLPTRPLIRQQGKCQSPVSVDVTTD